MALLPRTLSANVAEIQSSTNNYGLGQSRYRFTSRTFPEDLASDIHGHYMVININVPVDTSGKNLSAIGGTDGANLRGTSFSAEVSSGSDYSKVDKLRFSTFRGIAPSATTASNFLNANWALATGTRRIVESIAIHMPTPVLYNSQHLYEEVSLTAIAGQLGKLGASAVGAALTAAVSRSAARAINAAGAVGNVFSGAGRVIGTASRLLGSPINPKVEVLFVNTPQRQFNFEFLMAPKSQKESDTMKTIIETLRYHSAPELSSFSIPQDTAVIGGIGIPTFIPPATFDITFYQRGVENTNIPRINTCVMERIEVDYAPTGIYSTFRNGHPVAARLSISFRELEILHKARIAQGF